MTTPTTKRRPGRPAKLHRDQVLAAAVELADESGLQAVTMRTVASRLGAEAMSLYRHVDNKDDLLDGMVDLVHAEIELPVPDEAWLPAMRAHALSARNTLKRHPWAIGIMESRLRPGPANLRHHDAVLAVLLNAGLSSTAATRIFNLLDSYIFGFAIQEASLPVSTPADLAEIATQIADTMPADEYPHLARVSRELIEAGFEYAAEFEAGLDLVLASLSASYHEGTS